MFKMNLYGLHFRDEEAEAQGGGVKIVMKVRFAKAYTLYNVTLLPWGLLSFFEFYFIYFFIQQVLISHPFYTY